ncbi:MAG: hypothetical protein JOZ41_21835, partial [Chloroflexi bacterium]|nr:hypothetical protein [Chloroflexota bacterium]
MLDPLRGFGIWASTCAPGQPWNCTQRCPRAPFAAMVFQPLGMTRSSYRWMSPKNDPSVATGHDGEGKPAGRILETEPNAATSLLTTPTDIARFLLATLDPGRDSNLLRLRSVAEMLRPQLRL